MKLEDAWYLCHWWQAKLVITDPTDPLATGTEFPESAGTLYLWVRGHTVPVYIPHNERHKLPEKDQERCVCGDYHGFGKILGTQENYERWARLQADERWEPVHGMSVLDALIRKPLEEELSDE